MANAQTRSFDLRSRLIPIGHLLSGNFMNALIVLVSTAIAARALGPAVYGVMVIVLSFGRLIERLVRFESWQAVIRYAAEEEITGDKQRLSRLYAFGLGVDALAAMAAGLLSVAIAWLAGSWFDIGPGHLLLVAIYAVALVFNIAGVPNAALRMAGQFKLLAYAQMAGNVLRIVLAAICLWLDAGVTGFMIAWTLAQLLGSLLMIWLGLRAMTHMGIPAPWRADLRGLHKAFPGFFSFAFSSNLSLTLRVITTEADTLFVGGALGPSAAAVYYLAKRIAKVAMQVGAQVQQVIYPDVARLWMQGAVREFRSATLQVQAALAAVCLVMIGGAWVLGRLVIDLGLGTEYASAYPLLLTQLVAVFFTMHAAPARSAVLAMNESWRILTYMLMGTVAFWAVAFVAVPVFGAMGANMAHIAFAAITAILLDIRFHRRTMPLAQAAAAR
ncbi:lipopolysaccharide biosynthesis protein [Aurantiacibacter spongiae]|uniref:Lipopolysaccharide biosynthesis protein n=1 Tax=Aurantiacibacter spongiae TaxID=2488860 RepID=A0A3N5CS44_9SPHN|nr:oligosaccharide flippase family protein [Aurantiacibacter spongiae]RPF71176.1 lipopolysaccharide biosynthesis protein [Aurantiacibacter spongiae]